MIQLRPQISLKVDKLSKDGICLRICGWIFFYIVLQILLLVNDDKFISSTIPLKLMADGENTEYNATKYKGDHFFRNVNEIQLYLNVQFLKTHFMDVEHTYPKGEEVLKDMEYQLIVLSQNQTVILNQTHTTSIPCTINDEITPADIKCSGYLEEVIVQGITEGIFFLELHHKNAKAIQSSELLIKYENEKFFLTIYMFQILFLFLIIYGIYYFYSNLSDYPRQMWPKIHQWLSILLIGMLFYNFPIQMLRGQFNQLVHFYSNISELFIQSSLFYFWLFIFELEFTQSENEQNQATQFNIWKILKLLLVVLYTVPQALMDTYIFIMQEEQKQFDPSVEITFFKHFQKFVVFSLAAYSISFIFLLYTSFKKEAKLLITEPQPLQNEKHDPFAEGFAIQRNESFEIRDYKLLHILSTICFSVLVYHQLVSILNPIHLISSSTINEWSLINIYICLVVQLYMPYHEPLEDEQQNQMYGEVEMDDYKSKYSTVRSKKLTNRKFYTKKKEESDENSDIQI